MKTFTTVALTCCFIVVIALQAIVLRNQNHRETVIRYQSIDRAVPQIENVSYSVEEGVAAVAETAAAESPDTDAVPTLTIAESEPPSADASAEPAPIPANPEAVPPLSPDFPDTGPAVADAPPQPNFDPFGEAAEEPPAFDDPAASQQARDEKEKKPDPELAKYPVWLLIKPDGVQFLQTEEEIATHFHAIPPHAFLIGCQAATFKAGTVAELEGASEPENGDSERAFLLGCQEFTLKGSFGTKQTLEIKGDTLEFSTESQQIRLEGKEEQPLEVYSVDDSGQSSLQADEITLQLHEDGFQLSAEGASGVEINPHPDPKKQPKPNPRPGGFEQSPRDSFDGDKNSFG